MKAMKVCAVVSMTALAMACEHDLDADAEVFGVVSVERGGLLGSFSAVDDEIWITADVMDVTLAEAADQGIDVSEFVIRVGDHTFEVDQETGIAPLGVTLLDGALFRACLVDASGQAYRVADLGLIDAEELSAHSTFVASNFPDEWEL